MAYAPPDPQELLHAMQKDLQGVERELDQLQQEITRLQERRSRKQLERDLIVRYVGDHLLPATATTGGVPKFGLSEGVRQIVARHPGITRQGVIAEVLPYIATASKSPEKTLRQTILNLVQRGTLRLEGERLFPEAQHPSNLAVSA